MLAFCRSLTAVIALGLAVTASAAQERGSRDADVNNSHEDTRQHVSEHREQSGVLALLPGDSVTEHNIDLPSGKLAYTATAGTFALFDQSGERSAEIFYTAFVVKSANAAAARPVTFCFQRWPRRRFGLSQFGHGRPAHRRVWPQWPRRLQGAFNR